MPQVTGFAASQVQGTLQRLEEKWEDARANQNARYNVNTSLLRGIWDEQTADLAGDLTENDGCKPVKVTWLENGDHTVEEETDQPAQAKIAVDCDIDGPTAASNAVEYFMDDALTVTLKIREKDCSNAFLSSDQFDHMMLSKQIDLVTKLAQKMLLFMASAAGQSTTAGKLGAFQDASTPAGRSLIKVATGNFNALDFTAFVSELSQRNRFFNPAVFDGDNLLYTGFNARYQQNTPAGDKGDQKHLDTVRLYSDGLDFAQAGLSDRTFIVDQGALALFTAAFLPPVEEDKEGDGYRYTTYRTPILGLTQAGGRPVEADTIFMSKKLPIAPGSTKCEIYNIWKMRLWYLPLVNPLLSVNDGVTGVLAIKNDPTKTQVGTPMQKSL